MDRLQKVLAHAGIASRRKCEDLILQKRVKVNGKVVDELGIKVDPVDDQIEVDGKLIKQEEKIYVLMNKPAQVITSVHDPEGRKVVTDYLKMQQRIYPVGRLDYETEGLLILTNDGELTNLLTHPRHEIDKVYHAKVKGIPNSKKIERLAKGIHLEDGWTSPGKARLLKKNEKKNEALLEMIIHEGRNRQIRRMCEAIDHPVRHLKRVAIGFLSLDGLKPGKYRLLKDNEILKLKQQLS